LPYHQDTAFHPLIDLFERVVLRFERSDAPDDRRRKLEGFLVQIGLPLQDVMPHFCSLLSIDPGPDYPAAGLPPDQQKQQTIQALLAVLFRRAAQQPLLFVVEDLQWVDPTTVELLTRLIDQIHVAPILALLTSRPDFRSPWADDPAVVQVNLGRLSGAEAAELISHVAQGKSLPDEIVDQVVTRTDGVPLFIEELTKSLLESGLLEQRGNQYELSGPLPPLAIPNTLHDSLMARLDRLSTVKALAQLGAAIGREFSYALVRAVSPWDEDVLQSGLEQLVSAEFLFQDGSPPRATYRFKHALIQDAAYQSLLKSTRRQHHQRIALTIESGFPELVTAQPELLAHHYTEAGLTAHAIPFWMAAARRSLQSYANPEAANHATRGVELLATLPDSLERAGQELAFQLVLGAAATFVTGPHSVERFYERARELARQVGSTPELFPALAGLAYAQLVRGHMTEARGLSEEFLALAQPLADPLTLSAGHWVLAYTAWWQGDVVEVRYHARECLALYNPDQHRAGIAVYNNNPGVVCGYLDALASWVLGYPTEAALAMDRAVSHARELEHPYSISVSLLFSAMLSQLRREPGSARTRAEQALAVSEEHSMHALTLWCLLPRGWALAQQGDVPAGLADIREAMERRRKMGMGAVWPWFLALAAEAYGALGQIDEGLAALEEAQQWVQRNDERLYAAEVYRIRGELLLSRSDPDRALAEQCFQQALDVARDQQAKSWELRAALSLARMWQGQSRFADAHALVAPVYQWFTEGFDTKDLQEAKAFLDATRR
jgi:tetratricopeptide (TPR) repeat protein